MRKPLSSIRFEVSIRDILKLEENGLIDEEIVIIEDNPIDYFWTEEGEGLRIKLESIAEKMIADGEDYSIEHI